MRMSTRSVHVWTVCTSCSIMWAVITWQDHQSVSDEHSVSERMDCVYELQYYVGSDHVARLSKCARYDGRSINKLQNGITLLIFRL